jgi:hypothetical protein
MEGEKEQIRNELSGDDSLKIARGRSFMFDNIDSFVAMSHDDTSVTEVEFYPFDSAPGNYEFWDKVGQIVGNLMELKTINIHFFPYTGDDEEEEYDNDDNGDEVRVFNWETLTRILPYVRHKPRLTKRMRLDDVVTSRGPSFSRGLARSIRYRGGWSGFH